MFSDTLTAGYDFWGLTVDDETGVIVGQDQANGKIAAYSIDENEQLQYLWERNYGLPGIYFLNMVDEAGNFGTVKLLVQE